MESARSWLIDDLNLAPEATLRGPAGQEFDSSDLHDAFAGLETEPDMANIARASTQRLIWHATATQQARWRMALNARLRVPGRSPRSRPGLTPLFAFLLLLHDCCRQVLAGVGERFGHRR